MGGLVSSTIPSLISGVSQQPWNVRLVTQAEEQVNCFSSVVDFMKRRPATRHIAKLSDPAGWDIRTATVHHVNRDQNEQYLVLAGHRKLEVFDLNGNKKTVRISASGLNYLDCGVRPESSPLRFLTINDYTFVVNTTKTVSMLPYLTPAQPNEAFVFIKQASYNTTYTVYLDNVPFSFTTADGVAPADQPADPLSSTEIASMLATKILSQTTSDVTYSGTVRGTFHGTLRGEQFEPGHYDVPNNEDSWVPDRWVLKEIIQSFTGEGTVTPFTGNVTGNVLTGTFPMVFTTGPYAVNWRNCVFTGSFQGETLPPLVSGTPAGDVYEVGMAHSTLFIRRKDGADFTIRAEDSRSNSHITSWKGKVQNFADLPKHALNNSVVEVTGDAGNAFDTYYVRFVTDSSTATMGKGTWKETVAPFTPCKLDHDTMPHVLIRQADGTFSFEPILWGERTCGDVNTAPDPSFVGRTLSGLFFYRNRLAFLSGENVIMSQVGEFFSFFPSTVTTMVDNDSIDVAASHTRPTALEHAAIFSGGLLLFTADTQFTLEHDTVLSSATASIKPVTEFSASMKAQPVSSGKTVFFAVDRGKYAGIREYLTLPDNTDQNDAADITAHIPRYIGGQVHKLICSSNEDVLFVLSRNEPSRIWIYKYFWNGAEKVQSSWSRWDMAGDVVSGFMLYTDMYLIMKYEDGIYLERMALEPGYKDPQMDFEVRLDRKITTSAGSLAYDPSTRLTTITLPFPVATLPACIDLHGVVFPSQTLAPDKRAFTVKGDASQSWLVVGLPFESVYTFSTFAMRDQNNGGNAVMAGRLQLRSLAISCADTGYLTVTVTPKFRDTSTHVFTARELGHGSNRIGKAELYTGLVKVPILSLNTQVTVGVRSSSVQPFALVNATWEGFYTTRSQRT